MRGAPRHASSLAVTLVLLDAPPGLLEISKSSFLGGGEIHAPQKVHKPDHTQRQEDRRFLFYETPISRKSDTEIRESPRGARVANSPRTLLNGHTHPTSPAGAASCSRCCNRRFFFFHHFSPPRLPNGLVAVGARHYSSPKLR